MRPLHWARAGQYSARVGGNRPRGEGERNVEGARRGALDPHGRGVSPGSVPFGASRVVGSIPLGGQSRPRRRVACGEGPTGASRTGVGLRWGRSPPDFVRRCGATSGIVYTSWVGGVDPPCRWIVGDPVRRCGTTPYNLHSISVSTGLFPLSDVFGYAGLPPTLGRRRIGNRVYPRRISSGVAALPAASCTPRAWGWVDPPPVDGSSAILFDDAELPRTTSTSSAWARVYPVILERVRSCIDTISASTDLSPPPDLVRLCGAPPPGTSSRRTRVYPRCRTCSTIRGYRPLRAARNGGRGSIPAAGPCPALRGYHPPGLE